jgi:tetratricopeptide (TPR) repeat protein
VLALVPLPLSAHPLQSDRLARLDQRIAEETTRGDLYLSRGDLRLRGGDAQAALRDFELAEEHGADPVVLDLARSRAYLALARPEAAASSARRFLAARPDHPVGLLTLGQALAAQQQHRDASAVFTRALEVSEGPRPELYLRRARSQAAAGDLASALRGLDEGTERLGPLTALQRLAVELELQRGRPEAALGRLDRLRETSPQVERWLLERARILQELGRTDEARSSLEAALASLAARPPHRRRAPALTRLASEIHRAMDGLAAREGTGSE